MRITRKGQVTISQGVRNRLGLLPHTEVEFEARGNCTRIRKSSPAAGPGLRGQNALSVLRGAAGARMSTNEIMALTRDDGRERKKSR
jgi:bifunctional DNA-binding transcriptional regulator/antitoxin component of YhaV-PrlF toxin-antitoxin module